MAAPDDARPIFGTWTAAELAKTARADAGLGSDAGLPPLVRFVSNVAKLVRRRRAQPNAGLDPLRPAVFLLHPIPPEHPSSNVSKRVPMLDNGMTVVNGRIWFVSAGPGSGRYIDFAVADDEELFQLVTTTLGLGATPAIVFDPRPPTAEARFYAKGLDDPDHYETVSLSDGDVTLDRIFDAIENVYKSCLVTPEAQLEPGKLWRNPNKWWPSPKAEAVVQLNLKAGLVAAFPTCTVRHEQTMPEGRLDLEVEQCDPLDRSQITRHAVLELKVLRSFRETGAPVPDKATFDWVESGVKQAAAYRNSKSARASALCCFDMRKENTGEVCFEHVRELAKGLSVELRRWFLYAKSRHYREALASGL